MFYLTGVKCRGPENHAHIVDNNMENSEENPKYDLP